MFPIDPYGLNALNLLRCALPQVDGMMVWLSSGENIVWAVSANGALWYRAGIEQACPMGTNWFRVDTANDKWVRDTSVLLRLPRRAANEPSRSPQCPEKVPI